VDSEDKSGDFPEILQELFWPNLCTLNNCPKFLRLKGPEGNIAMMEQGLTVGRYLQKQREEKKVFLESVAGVTRITLANLQALERDEFHLLPAEIFTLGFLRAYAKFLHLDPTEVITAYRLQMEAKRRQAQDEGSAHPPSRPLLKYCLNPFLDFIRTIMGAAPSFSLGKVILPPKH
jgi:hypothetical protein